MPVRDAVAAIRRDPKWKSKLGIGLLVNLVPYVGLFALRGWLLDYERAVAWGVADGLPEWGDWTERAKNGLFALVPGLIVGMVLGVLLGLLMTPAYMIPAFSVVSQVGPGGVLEPSAVLAPFVWTTAAMMFATLALSALLVPFTYVPAARYALYRDLRAALQWKVVWGQIRAGGPAFRRAWGTSAAYLLVVGAIVTGGTVPLMLLQFGLVTGGPGPGQVAWAIGGMLAFGAVYALVVVLAIPVSVVLSHLWGEWARGAYRLEESPAYGGPRADAAAAAPEPLDGA